jgi:DNA-binding protein, histone-like, putative
MSRTYSVKKKRIIKSNGQVIEKYYAYAVSNQTVTTEDISKEIQEATSLTPADILATMRALSDVLERKLALGCNVRLDGLGIFSISAQSPGFDSAAKVKPNTVAFSKVCYRADKKLQKAFKDLKFEKQQSKTQH